MARLVDDLLSLSRIELNEHVAPTGRVALAPVIEEVARGLELRAAERGIRIVPLLPPDLPEVQGDRDETGAGLSEPARQRRQIRPAAQRDHGNRQPRPRREPSRCVSPSPIRAKASPASTCPG